MGWISGYPTGGKISSELYCDGKCTRAEASRLLSFTNTSGPLFIIGTVGIAMFNNPQIGFILLVSHFLGSITVGILMRNKFNALDDVFSKFSSPRATTTQNPSRIVSQNATKINTSEHLNMKNLGKSVGTAIQNTFSTLILIGGYIVFFALLGEILSKLGIISYFSKSICGILESIGATNNPTILLSYIESTLCGLLEVTNGLKMISSLGTSTFTLCLSSFVLRIWGHLNINANSKYHFKKRIINETIPTRKSITRNFKCYLLLYYNKMENLTCILNITLVFF